MQKGAVGTIARSVGVLVVLGFCVLASDYFFPWSIRLDPAVSNLGKVDPGSFQETSFYIRNFLPFPAKLIQIVTSCECTAAVPSENQISGFGATKILATAHIPHADIQFRQNIAIKVSNWTNRVVAATITARIWTSIQVLPFNLDFGTVNVVDPSVEKRLILVGHDIKKLTSFEGKLLDGRFFSLREGLAEDHSPVWYIAPKKDLPCGQLADVVRVKCENRFFDVPISCKSLGAVTANPEVVFIDRRRDIQRIRVQIAGAKLSESSQFNFKPERLGKQMTIEKDVSGGCFYIDVKDKSKLGDGAIELFDKHPILSIPIVTLYK